MKRFQMVQKVGLGVTARGWSQVTALGLAIVAARVLGKADFGIYAIASAFVVLLQGLMYGGIYDYVIKDKSDDGILSTCFWMNLLFGAAGMVVVLGLSFILGALTHTPEVTTLMIWLAPSSLIAAASSWEEAVLLRRGQLRTYYTLWLVNETLASGLTCLLFFHHFGLYALVLYRYAQLSLAAIGYFFLVRLVPSLEWKRTVVRDAFGFAINIYVSRIVGTIANYSGDILIGTLVNPAAAGAYRLASRIVTGVSDILYQPIATMAWVQFARARGKAEALKLEWFTLLAVLTITAWPALAGLAFAGHSALLVIVGPGWDEAVPIIAVLGLARMFGAFDVFFEPMLGVLDRSAMILKVRSLASLATVALLAILTHFGAAGAAAAQVIVAATIAVIALRIGRAATGASPKEIARSLAPGVVCTLAAPLGAALAFHASAAQLSAVGALAVLVCGGVALWSLCLFTLSKLQAFRSIVAYHASQG